MGVQAHERTLPILRGKSKPLSGVVQPRGIAHRSCSSNAVVGAVGHGSPKQVLSALFQGRAHILNPLPAPPASTSNARELKVPPFIWAESTRLGAV